MVDNNCYYVSSYGSYRLQKEQQQNQQVTTTKFNKYLEFDDSFQIEWYNQSNSNCCETYKANTSSVPVNIPLDNADEARLVYQQHNMHRMDKLMRIVMMQRQRTQLKKDKKRTREQQ